MRLNDLFCVFCFHDGLIENISMHEKNMIILFSLTTFLQNAKTKEIYNIHDKIKNSYLSVKIKFNNCTNLKNTTNTDINNLENFELWDTSYNELVNEIELHLRNDIDNTISTISFSSNEVEIISCDIKTI